MHRIFLNGILDQKGKRNDQNICQRLNGICGLDGSVSMLIYWFRGLDGCYVGKYSCFRKIHSRVFRSDEALCLQLALK